jgi:hypothetical protein
MQYKNKNLSFDAVVNRISLGLIFIALTIFALALMVLSLAFVSLLSWHSIMFLLDTGYPYLIEHPIILGLIPIVLGLFFVSFVLGDKLIDVSEQEQLKELDAKAKARW